MSHGRPLNVRLLGPRDIPQLKPVEVSRALLPIWNI